MENKTLVKIKTSLILKENYEIWASRPNYNTKQERR